MKLTKEYKSYLIDKITNNYNKLYGSKKEEFSDKWIKLYNSKLPKEISEFYEKYPLLCKTSTYVYYPNCNITLTKSYIFDQSYLENDDLKELTINIKNELKEFKLKCQVLIDLIKISATTEELINNVPELKRYIIQTDPIINSQLCQ